MFMAATHNGISRLYETFGNSGSADTEERTLTANETSRTWFRQNPPISRVRWSLRNNNNYEQTGLLISLNQIASNRVYLLRNFYEKSKRSILKAKVKGPAAYVFPATIRVPAPRPSSCGCCRSRRSRFRAPRLRSPSRCRRGRPRPDAAAAAAAAGERTPKPPKPPRTRRRHRCRRSRCRRSPREFPAGSYIVRMDQPYSRIADALLDYQVLGPNDAQSHPYDDTGWTFPEGFAVQAVRVTDAKVLDVAMEPVKGKCRRPAASPGKAACSRSITTRTTR